MPSWWRRRRTENRVPPESSAEQPAPLPDPPPDFHTRDLPLVEQAGPWFRLHSEEHRAIHFSRGGRGRFDGPEQGYGILYVGTDAHGPFVESFGRTHGARAVEEAVLRRRTFSRIESTRPLRLASLIGDALVRIGADSRVSSGEYRTARRWARAIWAHPARPDGLLYRSRHDGECFCCGLFDRTADVLREDSLGSLLEKHTELLGTILERYGFGLI